jgi:hypothetical protein
MIAEANWGNFKAKFNGREEKAFESLCLLLFYKEHGRPTGALRYFNQPGIEAEPIIVGTEVIGMQAKFISSNISRYKTKLIDAIDDAKAQHPALTKVYFYLNLDFAKHTKDGYNVSHINHLFKDYGAFTFSDFIREHGDFAEKYVVVDSAEKLSDIERPEVFQEFLSSLKNNGWRILFTTRLSYLEALKYEFIEIYHVPFEPLNIPGLTEEELSSLSETYEFALPQNERLRRLIQNPFYLNEYLHIDPKGHGTTTYGEFREAIWNRQIARSSYKKDNIHRRREECFLKIARIRAASGSFFVTVEGYDDALRQLESDEIIKFDQNARGYFITHDIYEEWALERTIEQSFRALSGYTQFYHEIGDALAVRRAFRGWLSEKLATSDSDATRLIEVTIKDDAISRHWKDECIVSALLSNYCGTFIRYFEQKLLQRPKKLVEQGESSLAVRRLCSL